MGGAWHYCGRQAVVHLIETSKKFKTEEAQIEHFAFRSNGTVKAFQKKMRDTDTPYKVQPLTEINMIQVNVFDPDGNKIEIQFAASEADLEAFGGSPAARRRMRRCRRRDAPPPGRALVRVRRCFGSPQLQAASLCGSPVAQCAKGRSLV